jgi:glutamate/tyrosine decarboxylase-like PLP-dependent enzyme
MHSQLKKDFEAIDKILNQTVELAKGHFENLHSAPPSRFIPDIPMEHLPVRGVGAIATLEYFANNYSDKLANSTGPKYFGFVTGGSTPAAVAGDWLVSAYDQNACGSNDSIAPQIERQTIHFFKELFGLDLAYFGSFVTGATIANFSGLALGRQWVGEQQGIDFSNEGLTIPIKVLSGTPHSSVIKSLSMLGLGRKAMVTVGTMTGREALDISKLEEALKKNAGPVIVVANSGTVNTVDFDDLAAIGKLKSKYNFWLHVDAAFGGFAACSEKYAHYLEGINYADSITIDAHKWLNVPYDAAMQFTRHKDIQLRVFQNSAVYLGDAAKSPDYFHYTPENSRRFRALPSWFTLLAYGKEGYREIVERNCEIAHYFGELIKSSNDFKILAPVSMNVVCFTFKEDDTTLETIRNFLDAVRDDGRVFFNPTVYNVTPAIRAAISNWLTEQRDIEIAFQVIESISHKLKKATLI